MRLARLGVWPPLPLSAYRRRARPDGLPFPLGDPACRLFARARHGLWHGVQACGLRPGDEVLVPAYHHGSEVEALRRAGLAVRFYEATETLEPDADELESLLGPRVRALHLTHYLGFPQDAARWRAWCDAHGLLLLEDAAQAWLAARDGDPLGSSGDVSIFCLYKTFGLPDGAAVLARAPLPALQSKRRSGLLPLTRRHALWLMSRSGMVAALASLVREAKPYDPAEDFALGDAVQPPASSTLFLIPRVADGGAATRRRANYALLLTELSDRVRPPFTALPAGASPFAFPVESDRKDKLLERLAERGIAALDFWAVPHPSLPRDRFPGAAARRAHTVALPVHQELRLQDLERLADAARPRSAASRSVSVHPLGSDRPSARSPG